MQTFDPSKLLVSFGVIPITGFAPDSFLTVERNEEGYTAKAGATGEVARAKNNNRTGKCTFRLLATSQCNDLLSAMAALDDLTGAGVAPLFGKELNGTTLWESNEAWIEKLPTIERGKEVAEVEWVIYCADLRMFVGGLF